jgi:Cohesin domain
MLRAMLTQINKFISLLKKENTMKKIYLLSFFLSLFTSQLKAVELQLSNETASLGSQITMPLTAKNFTNVIGIQFSINFDPSVLQYISHTTSNPVAAGYEFGINNTASGQIAGLWIDPALTGLSISDNTELIRVTFKIIGGVGTTTNVTISETPTPFVALDGGLAYSPTSFSNGSVAIVSVLPIDLQSFTAKRRHATTTDLAWQTASEKNTVYFAVEQSTTGTNFQTIGEVKAKGTTTTPQYYGFTDDNSITGINYYRLKMVDTDSKFRYSTIITVDALIKNGISVQKRGDQLAINGLEKESEVTIILFDLMGRVVLYSKKSANTEGGILQSFPFLISGMYIVTVRSKQNSQSAKIFIEK